MGSRAYTDAYEAMDRIFGMVEEDAETRFYDLLNRISVAVVEYRMERQLSQSDLAKRLGVSQAMVSKYESGDYNFTLRAAMELFDKLGISFHAQLGKEDASPRTKHPILSGDRYKAVAYSDETLPEDDSVLFQAS